MKPLVTILLGTCNGGRFITEQLDTIAQQTHTNWELVVSDDGSSDETLAVLGDYTARWPEGRLTVRRGPCEGFCRNFLYLACDPGKSSDIYAFADQDDIWEPEKIERAVAWIENIPPGVPALYCSRTKSVDECGKELGFSPLFMRPPSFKNALVQSIGGGNTMVFNEAARRLLASVGADVSVPSHDWWLYILVTGCGGAVYYDPEPRLRYRQHAGNIVGSNVGLSARLARLTFVLRGRFSDWNDLHLAALSQAKGKLTPENLTILDQFAAIRRKPFLERMRGFYNLNLQRQTLSGQVGLWLAVALRRV